MKSAWSRTPVILQTGPADCGAACVAMVLAAHGKAVPLAQIKRRLRIARTRGIDAWKLLRCAAFYGLQGEGLAGSARAIRRLTLPAILHWRENHFVVLVRWKATGAAEIIDPAAGRQIVGFRKFSQMFSGTAMHFRPAARILRETQTLPGPPKV
jgi:ABC-type bacteriocin/lantibiotic exporter with double-glycine peptidase domain